MIALGRYSLAFLLGVLLMAMTPEWRVYVVTAVAGVAFGVFLAVVAHVASGDHAIVKRSKGPTR